MFFKNVNIIKDQKKKKKAKRNIDSGLGFCFGWFGILVHFVLGFCFVLSLINSVIVYGRVSVLLEVD